MKKLNKLFICLATLSSSSAFAANNAHSNDLIFSGNVSLASEYRWRGQTQTKNDPALQSNFLLSHSSGVYFSTFVSSLDFGDEAQLELDPMIGYSTPVKLGTLEPTADIGMLRYTYVGNSHLNYNEYYFKMIFNRLFNSQDNLTPSISYTNNYGGKAISDSVGKDVSNWYFNVLYSTPISQTDFGANASLGYSKASEEIYGSDAKDDFFDWKIGATYTYKPMGINAELAAIGSNLNTKGFTDTNKKGVKTAAVFTLTKSF
ncbi:TorF family putative porin [Acinetobacter terrestris]|uniref:TorF family putative porin n=1 Tax=Acinetobacter terrestris TaxID=2529843 RepID=UPI00352581C9